VFSPVGNAGIFTGLAFRPDGRRLASASSTAVDEFFSGKPPTPGSSGMVKVRDVETGHELLILEGRNLVPGDLAFRPDGRYVASAVGDHTIVIWDGVTGRMRSTFRGHVDAILCLAFRPAGRRLASGGRDKMVKAFRPPVNRSPRAHRPSDSSRCTGDCMILKRRNVR
jgi:WD40 repeat protein